MALEPITREEKFMAMAAGEAVGELTPITRQEMFLKQIADSAGGGGGGGTDGEDGATFTPSVSEDGVLSWTNDKGLQNPTPVNIMGRQGVQGVQGVPGETGKDGVSVTHSWSGSVLTITSASGTSSADLKGDKGDAGANGFALRGTNPLPSLDKDTRQFWAGQGDGYWWIAGDGNLTEQPENYGFLENRYYGTGECSQTFYASATNRMYVRSGGAGASNADGWYSVKDKIWREVAFVDMLSSDLNGGGEDV